MAQIIADCPYISEIPEAWAHRAIAALRSLSERNEELVTAKGQTERYLDEVQRLWKQDATALAAMARDNEHLRTEFHRECDDADKVCRALGLPGTWRTDGGSLHIPRILAHIKERAEQAERELAEARELLAKIISAYDVYRGKGVPPAPTSYAALVAAIDAARAAREGNS